MRRLLVFSLVLALGMAASACAEEEPPAARSGGGDGHGEHGHGGEDAGEGHAAQGTKEIGGFEATYHGSTEVAGMSEFEVELDDSYFGPTVLEGQPGQSLTVSLHNEGKLPHTFTIDGVVPEIVDEQLQPGDEGVTTEVTFPKSGATVFYCRFHRDQGMVGALSVGGSLETEESASADGGYG